MLSSWAELNNMTSVWRAIWEWTWHRHGLAASFFFYLPFIYLYISFQSHLNHFYSSLLFFPPFYFNFLFFLSHSFKLCVPIPCLYQHSIFLFTLVTLSVVNADVLVPSTLSVSECVNVLEKVCACVRVWVSGVDCSINVSYNYCCLAFLFAASSLISFMISLSLSLFFVSLLTFSFCFHLNSYPVPMFRLSSILLFLPYL